MMEKNINKGVRQFIILMACLFLSIKIIMPAAISAEGISADMTMTLSRSTLNLGKSFSVTVAVKPNSNINITSFDFTLGFDSTKVEVVKTGSGIPKTGYPSNVPESFEYGISQYGDSIIALCNDGTSSENAPIKASSSTPIITFYFNVKSTAIVGSTTNFSITEATVNQATSNGPVEISLNIKSPKTGTIGARLDTNNYLSSLTTDIGVLSPEFIKTTGEYLLDVPQECDAVNFTAAAVSAKASFKISGGEGLDYGPNTITIKVTAEDPDFVRTYTITVNRANPPTPTPEATPTTEPTEYISSGPESSSDTSSSSIGPESAESSDTPVDGGIWKTLTILFASLFLITAATTLWLTIDKVRNRDRIIKVKRV